MALHGNIPRWLSWGYRKAPPRALVSQKPESQALQGGGSAEVKALKAELGAMAAELREASTELAELKLTRKDLRCKADHTRCLRLPVPSPNLAAGRFQNSLIRSWDW